MPGRCVACAVSNICTRAASRLQMSFSAEITPICSAMNAKDYAEYEIWQGKLNRFP